MDIQKSTSEWYNILENVTMVYKDLHHSIFDKSTAEKKRKTIKTQTGHWKTTKTQGKGQQTKRQEQK